MLNDMEDLNWFLYISHLRLLRNDQVNVHIGMDEIPIGAPPNGTFYSHQAVLLEEVV